MRKKPQIPLLYVGSMRNSGVSVSQAAEVENQMQSDVTILVWLMEAFSGETVVCISSASQPGDILLSLGWWWKAAPYPNVDMWTTI